MGGVLTDDLVICNICKKQTSEAEIKKTKSGKLVCEECYDPADPDQREEGEVIISNDLEPLTENQAEISFTNYPSYTFTKQNEQTEEIFNTEQLNNDFQCPSELKIIDCPPDVNSDSN